jgi:hypothetical protein
MKKKHASSLAVLFICMVSHAFIVSGTDTLECDPAKGFDFISGRSCSLHDSGYTPYVRFYQPSPGNFILACDSESRFFRTRIASLDSIESLPSAEILTHDIGFGVNTLFLIQASSANQAEKAVFLFKTGNVQRSGWNGSFYVKMKVLEIDIDHETPGHSRLLLMWAMQTEPGADLKFPGFDQAVQEKRISLNPSLPPIKLETHLFINPFGTSACSVIGLASQTYTLMEQDMGGGNDISGSLFGIDAKYHNRVSFLGTNLRNELKPVPEAYRMALLYKDFKIAEHTLLWGGLGLFIGSIIYDATHQKGPDSNGVYDISMPPGIPIGLSMVLVSGIIRVANYFTLPAAVNIYNKARVGTKKRR